MSRQGTDHLRELLRLVGSDATTFVKLRLTATLALVVVASILTALGPVALKALVDGFAGNAPGLSFAPLTLIGLYVLSQWLVRVTGEIRGLVYARAERRLFRRLSERLFAHLMRLPLKFHLERQTGAVAQILENGLQGYQLILHHMVFTFLPVIAEFTTIVVVLAHVTRAPLLGLFCTALIGYAGAFAYSARSVSKAAKSASSAHIEANAVMTDGILNYETVKYFNAESIVQDKVRLALTRTEVEWVGFFRRYALNGLSVATIFAAFLAATVLYSSFEVTAGRMTLGAFVLVNSYMLQVVRPVEMLGYAMQGFSQGLAMLDRMFGLFAEVPEREGIREGGGHEGPADVDFLAVSLSYGSQRPVLRDVTLRVPGGKTLGVVGSSGSGKSSLVRLLVRLLEPDGGLILLDGVPVADISLSTLRRSIAVVPQDTVLFNDTLAHNIGFGRQGCTQDEIVAAAKLAHLHDFIMSLPEQYETRVGERGVKLSGGEKQRVSIARAAIKRPRIYVFDEATSSLDSNTERDILRNLRELSHGCTTLVIAHRLSTVVHADEIVVLEAGRVVERGTHSALLGADGRYAALWAAQQVGSIPMSSAGYG